MKKTIATILLTATIVAAFVYLLIVGVGKQEVVECNKWIEQADAYPAFFLAKWQADQCGAHGIIINAEVK